MRKKKRARSTKTSRRKAVRGKTTARRMKASARKTASKRKTARKKKTGLRRRFGPNWVVPEGKVPGPDTGGQSGDIEGLSATPMADSESVAELVEEGQAFEAEAISGVENAPDADAREVRTKEVPEDDVPPEYREPE